MYDFVLLIADAPVNYQVTLTNGISGLLYIYYNGQWGTVCDDHFDSNHNACTVVCRQLGYT